MTDPEALEARLARLERAVAELAEAVLLAVRTGPAHYEDARRHAQQAKGHLPTRDA